MSTMSIQGDETAPTSRSSLLLFDADPLLRWSIVTHLRHAVDIQVVQTLDEGGGLSSARSRAWARSTRILYRGRVTQRLCRRCSLGSFPEPAGTEQRLVKETK